MEGLSAPGGTATYARRLDRLFSADSPTGKPWTYRQVSDGIVAAGGPSISPTQLMYLRKGEVPAPKLSHLEALARFFGVSTSYLVDDQASDPLVEDAAVARVLHDGTTRLVVRQLGQLSPTGVDAVKRMIDALLEAERREQP